MAVSILPLMTFSFVGSVTPGPNNLMLTSSGVNYGFRKTMPHFFGVYFGFLFMLALVCLGLGRVFVAYPEIQEILRYVGSAYLLYLAFKIATAGIAQSKGRARPFNFIEAAMFQYVNPKAWMMAGTIASAFVVNSGDIYMDAVVAVAAHGLISFPCVISWVLFGTVIGRFLKADRARKVFNFAMAGLLVLTTYFILFG